ncbi:hypothetical protein JNN96_37780 [Mycobacterium sp. DSM 3803]|nr:hypothetical protein [Mycobacterium sp. DSM 3803]
MSTISVSQGWEPTAMRCLLVAGGGARVAGGVVGRLGRVSSTKPGCVLVRYDDGGREVVDSTRRPLWVLRNVAQPS